MKKVAEKFGGFGMSLYLCIIKEHKNKRFMTTTINRFGEKVTKWESTKHPTNPNFMQKVIWTVWEKPDGRVIISYRLDYNGKSWFIYDLTKDEAIEKYS